MSRPNLALVPRELPSVDGRPPPHDLDAEAAVLSAVMIDPATMDSVVGLVAATDFYSEGHRRIFEACVALHEENEPCDVVQVGTWLKNRDRISQVGGMAYLTELLGAAPATTNILSYARTVVLKATQRGVIALCNVTRAELYLGQIEDPIDHLARFEEAAFEACKRETKSNLPTHISKTSHAIIRSLNAPDDGERFSTGYVAVDRITKGLARKQLTIVAGVTSMGKTAYAINLALNVAESGHGVLLISLEMTERECTDRMACALGGVDQNSVIERRMHPSEYQRYVGAHAAISKMPIYISDEAGQTVSTVRAKARRVRSEMRRTGKELALVVVDYLQLMKPPSMGKNGTREQEVGELGRQMKGLSKDIDAHVLALSQLNEDGAKRVGKAKRPRLGDLRDSKAIGHHADFVKFVFRESYEQERDDEHGEAPDIAPAEIIVAKARGRRTGVAHLVFDRSRGRFSNGEMT